MAVKDIEDVEIKEEAHRIRMIIHGENIHHPSGVYLIDLHHPSHTVSYNRIKNTCINGFISIIFRCVWQPV